MGPSRRRRSRGGEYFGKATLKRRFGRRAVTGQRVGFFYTMRTLQAISSSCKVQEKISASKKIELTGVYERALNLRLSDGSMIGVLEQEAGNCPGNILIPSFFGLTSKIDVGTRVVIHPSSLQIGEILAISLQGISLWDPQIKLPGNLCRPSLMREKILNFLGIKNRYPLKAETLIEHYRQWNLPASSSSWGALLWRHLEKHLVGLCRGLLEGNRKKVKSGFSQIIGVGLGLTPSGDDLLVGIFGTLYSLLSHLGKHPSALPIWPSSEWVTGTTALGTSLVYHSLRGEIAQRVQNVIIGILTETGDLEKDWALLLAMGATSGKDTSLGILLGTVLGLEMGSQN